MPLFLKLLVCPVSDESKHGGDRQRSSLPAKEFDWWLRVYNRAMIPNETKMSDGRRDRAQPEAKVV
jgi:hypothetical protein